MSQGRIRSSIAFLGGLGASLLLGGLFATGLLIALPFQIGLFTSLGEATKDPIFFIFAGMAAFFLISACGGGYLCVLAYSQYKSNRPTVGAKND